MTDPTGTDPLAGASPGLVVALAVRFLIEIALLAGTAALAAHVASGGWRWPAAIVAVGVVATVWGLFLSPRAAVALPAAARLTLESALFLGIGAGLVTAGSGPIAAVGVAIWLVDRIAIAVLGRRPSRP